MSIIPAFAIRRNLIIKGDHYDQGALYLQFSSKESALSWLSQHRDEPFYYSNHILPGETPELKTPEDRNELISVPQDLAPSGHFYKITSATTIVMAPSSAEEAKQILDQGHDGCSVPHILDVQYRTFWVIWRLIKTVNGYSASGRYWVKNGSDLPVLLFCSTLEDLQAQASAINYIIKKLADRHGMEKTIKLIDQNPEMIHV